jgi:hypothetical protein
MGISGSVVAAVMPFTTQPASAYGICRLR